MSEMYFLTNRNPIPDNDNPTDFGPNFNLKGAPYLRVGKAILADPKPGDEWAPADLAIDALTVYPDMTPDPKAPKGYRYGSEDMIDAIKKRVFDNGDPPNAIADVLLFVHGFDTKFTEALQLPMQMTLNLERARQKLLTGAPAGAPSLASSRPFVLVVFTWPSDGEMVPEVSYWSDRTDAKTSDQALARVFLKLRDFLDQQYQQRLKTVNPGGTVRGARDALRAGDLDCGVRLHLVAQSMGNFVLRNGLQAFRNDPSVIGHPLPRMFDQIFLTGADDNDDAFSDDDMLRPLPDLAKQVTVYCNPGDKALFTSMSTKHLGKRLGQNGPKEVIDVANLAAVNIEDVLPASGDDFTGHYYYRLNHEVHCDMLYLMAGTPAAQAPGRRMVENNRYRLGYTVFKPAANQQPSQSSGAGFDPRSLQGP